MKPFAKNAPLETRGKLGKPFAQTALGKGVYTPIAMERGRKRLKTQGLRRSIVQQESGND
jgi:hypothetical protein